MFEDIVNFIKKWYQTDEFIPLHAPVFHGNEKEYLVDCIDSTFVSSVGKYVDAFEKEIAEYTGARFAIATVNGTAALHVALKLAGVEEDTEVITQPLTFVATANAITYCSAHPVFIDVEKDTMGLSPESLADFLKTSSKKNQKGDLINSISGRKISAILPMHTFGHPVRIYRITEIADEYGIPVIEDAAESLGSYYRNRHTGTFGLAGILSFNGNKVITTGGGGMIITDDEKFASRAKHITTTAKVSHTWEYVHNETGFNYRMPNVNAALGCAQLEQLDTFLSSKRDLAEAYKRFFGDKPIQFLNEPENSLSNYWLNTILLDSREGRDEFLEYTNSNGVMTRPVWKLMNHLEMYKECIADDLTNAVFLEERAVNIPSGVYHTL